jgi:pimeloyl-ACP methyl ester carboxylesterase
LPLESATATRAGAAAHFKQSLGDRIHLPTPQVDLDTHIRDVTSQLEYEVLQNVILVGHSYGGMVISGVSERRAYV